MNRTLLICACLVALPAAAENPYLSKARTLYAALQFTEAREQLEIARQVPSNDPTERLEVLALLAFCDVAEGRGAQAVASFEQLLALDPNWRPDPDVSPKILEVFDRARAHLFAPGFVRAEEQPASGLRIRARVIDPYRRIAATTWAVRNAEGWRFQPEPKLRGALWLDLPADSVGRAWYLEARDANGEVIARLGSRDEPRSAVLPIVQRPVEARSWKVPPAAWVVGGLTAVALAVGIFLESDSRAMAAAARREPWADAAQADQNRAVTEAGWGLGLFCGAGAGAAATAVVFVW